MDIFQATAAALHLLHGVIKYISAFRNAPEDRNRLLTLLQAVEGSIKPLNLLRDLPPDSELKRQFKSNNAVQCALIDLKALLEKLSVKLGPKPQKAKLKSFLKDATWPLQSSGVDKMMTDLFRLHQTISSTQLQLLHNITYENVRRLEEYIEAGYREAEVKELIHWLWDQKPSDVAIVPVDPELIVKPDWFWHVPVFKDWETNALRTSGSSLLWCPGELGVGKTIFAKCLWKELFQRHHSKNYAVLIYYFHYKDTETHTSNLIFGYLCRQLVEQRKDMLPLVKTYKQQQKADPFRLEEKNLLDLFESLLNKCDGSFVILDGFDECGSENEGRILHDFRNLLSSVSSLRLLFTGRKSSGIYFKSDPSMQIMAMETDLESYVRKGIQKIARSPLIGLGLAKLPEDEKDRRIDGYVKRILEQSGGRFLLAKSHLYALEGSLSLPSLEDKLSTLGSDIYQLYDACMERISRHVYAELGMQVLLWVVHAKRLLRVNEILQAYVTSKSLNDFDDNLFQSLSMDTLRASTGGLIEVSDAMDTVTIHKSVQDYFDRDETRRHYFVDGNYEVTRICLRYLRFKRFAEGHCVNEGDWDKRITTNIFFEYAALHWGQHVRDLVDDRLTKDIHDLLSNEGSIASAAQALIRSPACLGPPGWLLPYGKLGFFPDRSRGPLLGPLHLATYFNLGQTVERLISAGHGVNERSACGRTSLNIACMLGYGELTQVLLTHHANPNLTDRSSTTCLHAATIGGQFHIVRLLLKHGSSLLDKKGFHNETALHEAAARGLFDVVATLIDDGCDLSARLTDKRSALHLAAESGHAAVVRLIFKKSRSLGPVLLTMIGGFWNDQPIHSAAFQGHPDVIETLYDLGSDLDSRQKSKETPLHIACQHGRPNAVVKLLQLGSDPSALEEVGMTPLHLASRNGHPIIVEILLRLNREGHEYLERRCSLKGDTALHKAATSYYKITPDYWPFNQVADSVRNQTYLKCFKTLYQAGATIDATNDLGETPLYLAACAGNSDIIAFILEELSETGKAEALSKATNDRQLTPLHIAIIEGHKDVVRLLLEAGSDVRKETHDGLSALQLAKESNQEDMVNTVSSLAQKHDLAIES